MTDVGPANFQQRLCKLLIFSLKFVTSVTFCNVSQSAEVQNVWRICLLLYSVTVASIQIYFEGAKFFPQGGGGRSPRPEGPRAGIGFLGRGQRAYSPRPRWGAVSRTSKNLKFDATWDLKIHYRNALWRVSNYRKAKTLEGAKRHSRPSIFYWRGDHLPRPPRIDATAQWHWVQQ